MRARHVKGGRSEFGCSLGEEHHRDGPAKGDVKTDCVGKRAACQAKSRACHFHSLPRYSTQRHQSGRANVVHRLKC